VRGCIAALPLLAALFATGCAANADYSAAGARPTTDASPPSEIASTQRPSPRVQRLHHMPPGLRPDCRNARVNRVILGYMTQGWTLSRATAGLLRHPGADHVALSPVSGNRVTMVLYRSDGTTKATARLHRVNERWLPASIAACRSSLS
jgi:hypothetical protein